jgi:23S rRNA (cytosine1962-C5)-methyltransferase
VDLRALLERALDAREPLAARLAAEGTDCWRLFHGAAEGREGLSIDRYADVALLQTFREPLEKPELESLVQLLRERCPGTVHCVWNHRGARAVEVPLAGEEAPEEALAEREIRERGLRLCFRARHRGRDPWLFLDLRPGRRRLAELARGRSVLNLFAYTCGAGLAAAQAGAREVWNVDFAASALEVGRRSAARNGFDESRLRFVHEDALPVLRQLAGLPIKGRASARSYLRLPAQRFELLILDPPAWSKGPFGAVDVARDYAGLFKPALLATAEGGTILATNHVAAVTRAEFAAQLEACARKAGRPLAEIEFLGPDADFPARDGEPPLKIAVCRLA